MEPSVLILAFDLFSWPNIILVTRCWQCSQRRWWIRVDRVTPPAPGSI